MHLGHGCASDHAGDLTALFRWILKKITGKRITEARKRKKKGNENESIRSWCDLQVNGFSREGELGTMLLNMPTIALCIFLANVVCYKFVQLN